MFTDLIDYPIETDRIDYDVRHVLRDVDDVPTLFTRVTLSGTEFVQRALEPYVRVGDVESAFVEITEDGTTAKAYFDRPLGEGETVEFGYGAEDPLVRLRHGIRLKDLAALDPRRLPDRTRFVDRFFDDGEPILG